MLSWSKWFVMQCFVVFVLVIYKVKTNSKILFIYTLTEHAAPFSIPMFT